MCEVAIALGDCGSKHDFTGIGLGAATWYTLDAPNIPAVASAATVVHTTNGATHVSHDGKVSE